MPLRLPKMYSFIFGFQRLVWCPKWTPASSSSFMVMLANLPPHWIASGKVLPRRSGLHSRRPFQGNGKDFEHRSALALRELEALARALLPVLFAFLAARIARKEPFCLELAAQLGVELQQ